VSSDIGLFSFLHGARRDTMVIRQHILGENRMPIGTIPCSLESIAAFCERWEIAELSLFGSALRDDFRPDSDVDILFDLKPGQTMSIERFMDMRDELSAMFGGRAVDLVQKRLVTNPFRRKSILENRKILYVG
jgi:predicted nucleotidyltransferase